MTDKKHDALVDYYAEHAPEIHCPYCKEQWTILNGSGEYECFCGNVFQVDFIFDKKDNFIGANVKKIKKENK